MIDCSWKQCVGAYELVHHGGIYQEYGSWKTVYNRYNNWSKKGHLNTILMELKKGGDQELHIVDASIVKVHQDAMHSALSKI